MNSLSIEAAGLYNRNATINEHNILPTEIVPLKLSNTDFLIVSTTID